MPKDKITFADVEAFCREWGEGVRVEYKSKVANVPKTVSAFANSQGGVFIIGVKADKSNNNVEFPIKGIPNQGGLEDQVTNSMSDGIHPPVMPEITIVPTETEGHAVIVVRVDESPHAPHAIQNSTKVYIRTGSVSQPYKLADIDRIEYMLKRREDSKIIYGQILNQIEERVNSFHDPKKPSIRAIARPKFPYKPIISTREIHDFMGMEGGFGHITLSRVPGGAISRSHSHTNSDYWELNDHGIVYGRLPFVRKDPEKIDHKDFFDATIWLLRYSALFYNKCKFRGNIEMSLHLRNVAGKRLIYSDRSGQSAQYGECECHSSEVLASAQFPSETLVNSDMKAVLSTIGKLPKNSSPQFNQQSYEAPAILAIFEKLIGQLLWAFDIDREPLER